MKNSLPLTAKIFIILLITAVITGLFLVIENQSANTEAAAGEVILSENDRSDSINGPTEEGRREMDAGVASIIKPILFMFIPGLITVSISGVIKRVTKKPKLAHS